MNSYKWFAEDTKHLLHEQWVARMDRHHEPTDDEIDRALARRESGWIREPWIKAVTEMQLLANADRRKQPPFGMTLTPTTYGDAKAQQK